MTELEQLKSVWTSIDEKIERNWQLNVNIIQSANLDKVRSKMNRLVWIKAISMAFYGLFTLLFATYAISRWQVSYQAITGIVFAVWTLAVFITSMHELSLITTINYSEKIPVLQKKLIEIRLAIIRYLRLAAWMLPLYFGFIILIFDLFLGIDIVAMGDPIWLMANAIFSVGIFVPAAFWMHGKLSPKNANKIWMNKLLRGNGSQITDAENFLEEIKAYSISR